MTKATILDQIIRHKHEEILRNKKLISRNALEEQAKNLSDKRNFVASLRDQIEQKKPAVIAEIKKASPSKGLIRSNFNPRLIAADYEKAGATCLSVLTDEHFFQGSNEYLIQARAVCQIPVIRKDFMVDVYQIVESAALGADCVLLIVAALDKTLLEELASCAQEIGIDTLVEVHNEQDLEVALEFDFPLIGINNRNLHTFQTDLDTTFRLNQSIPKDRLVVTESGIHAREQIKEMLEHQIYGFLIGETFMRADKPGEKLRELFAGLDR